MTVNSYHCFEKKKEKHVLLSADIIDSISHGALILYLTIDIIVLKNKEKHVRLSANIMILSLMVH